ncbi:iron complex outermembrane receptor protein [Panacagrimonas perspica]|uniref:Iron complex outermembrane receptor protein n=1 Tax=Panacagrimonas perspica TaxID=381431 RepID=A0A4R7P4J2_9GAMM|nr:TonB-dependent receptor [Panacagrimonas perspica]TDU28617.1 iron complex outermembrane receptor protein [Panacagrimonas perspica]
MFKKHPLAVAIAALLSSFAVHPSESVVVDAPATEQAAAETGSYLEVASHDTHETDREVETITVSGQRSTKRADLPGASAGVTGTELRERVFINTEDALRHLPDLTIRKRYVGDRNALIGGRSHGTLQAPRGVVYADGVLLSNFLGRFNAPRWNMVAPEEISRVDVLYGPYSALYPGNSIGTTVLITTRDPNEFTTSGRVQFFSQDYKGYGYQDDYGGRQYSAFTGNRWGAWSGTLGINRLENDSQPMQYATGTRVNNPSAAVIASAVPVTGAIRDRDSRNQPRLILGPDGGSLEGNEQNQVKGRLSYQNDLFRADAQVGFWVNDFDRDGVSFLRDAGGATVTRGNIRVGDDIYTVANNAFGPQEGREEHLMSSLTVRTQRDSGWNFSGVGSIYHIGEDELRSSSPTDANTRAGNIVEGGSGDGWWNADLQASYRADGLPHTITLGYYHSSYDLDSKTFSAAEWRHGGRGTLTSASQGSTRQQALYAQDAWEFRPLWTATAGVRVEFWDAFDGQRQRTESGAVVTAPYDDLDEDAVSPKLSIAYAPEAYTLRYSVGRGVRFATVSELFQGSQTGTNIVNNNPDLKPEDSISHDLTLETVLADRHQVRVSLFYDRVKDTIAQQLNQATNVTNIQNVDRVDTHGVEFVYGIKELLPNVDLDANLSLVNSKIEKNDALPQTVGKHWVRVPNVRANLVANWRFLPQWNANLAARRSGRQYSDLDNQDTNDHVFGGASKFTTVDSRVAWHFRETIELGVGVENLTDEEYYIFHPYPGRTWIAELRATF